jgi:type I restriction enzyme S subunit
MSWPTVAIGDIASLLRNGMSIKQSPDAGGLPITRIETIASGIINLSRCGYAGLDREDCTGWLLQEGDILISHINSMAHLGKCAIYEERGIEVVHGMNLLNLRLDQRYALPRYIIHALKSKQFIAQISTIAKKSVNQASFNISTFKGLEIPLPPLEEQRRIAAILDKSWEISSLKQNANALIQELPQSLFLSFFGDPRFNPNQWSELPLGDLGRVVTGSTPPSSEDGMFDGAIPFITPGDLGSGAQAKRTLTETGALKSRTVKKGSALVCCIGATIGKMDIAIKESAFNQQINAVEWGDSVIGEFGIEVLRFYSQVIAKAGASTTLPILKKSSFEKLKIPVPPLDLQREYCQRLQDIEPCKRTLRNSLQLGESLNRSLLDRAFSGGPLP